MAFVLEAKSPALPKVPDAQLSLWDEAAPMPGVALRHSHRARRIAVRVATTGQVELVVPRGVSEHRAWAFLHSQSEWVQRHVARRRAQLPAPQAFPPPQVRLALTGETWRVFQAGGTGRTAPRKRAICRAASSSCAAPAPRRSGAAGCSPG
jgi:hypothetical protein